MYLRLMSRHRPMPDYRSYSLTCHGHWFAHADAVTAETLEPRLGERKAGGEVIREMS